MRSFYKIFHPEIFQGSLRDRNYFEGWYFKHVSAAEDDAFAVIPGISLSEDNHAFVQFIDVNTGESDYFRYETNIAFVSLNGKTTVMATYNGARVESLRRLDEGKTEVVIRKNDMSVTAVITKKGAYALKAPVSGVMKNIIKESLDSEVYLKVSRSGKTLFSETGKYAGYEETETIFSYF